MDIQIQVTTTPDFDYHLEMGSMSFEQQECEAAKKHLTEAIRISEKEFGAGHITGAIAMEILGEVEEGLGNFQSARELLQRALILFEGEHPKDHPLVLKCMRSLARCIMVFNEYEEAEQYFKTMFTIYPKVFGPNSMETAGFYGDFSQLLKLMGRVEDAKTLGDRASRIWKENGYTFG